MDRLAEQLWQAERMLMRFEALAAAWPRAALLWRVHASLAEAAATVEMDGSVASEREILLKLTGMQLDIVDPVGIGRATSVHRFLSSIGGPGWAIEDAVASIARMSHAELIVDEGEASLERDPVEQNLPAKVAEHLAELDKRKDIAMLPRLAATAFVLRAVSGHPYPLSERLLLVTADHQWREPAPRIHEEPAPARGGRKLKRKRQDLYVPTPSEARWLVLPSLILGRGIWEPSAPGFLDRFLQRAAAWLETEYRRFVAIARWSNKLDDFRGRRSTSTRGLLADYIASTPVLDTVMFAAAAGITPKGALGVIRDAEEAGLLLEVTGRYAYKIFASPALAHLLRDANPTRPRSGDVTTVHYGQTGEKMEPAGISASGITVDDEALDKLLAELSEVTGRTARIVAKADDTLKNYTEERRRALTRYEED